MDSFQPVHSRFSMLSNPYAINVYATNVAVTQAPNTTNISEALNSTFINHYNHTVIPRPSAGHQSLLSVMTVALCLISFLSWTL